MIYYFLFFILCVFYPLTQSQTKLYPGKSDFFYSPNFYTDIICLKGSSPSETKVDIFVQVPFDRVKFLKTNKTFQAEYSITVSVYDSTKTKLITERTWNEKIETGDYNQSVSRNNYNLSLRTFSLRPGDYHFKVAVEDKDTRKKYTAEMSYEIRELSGEISLSDIILIASQVQDPGGNKITPNVSGNIVSQRTGIPFFVEVYSDSVVKRNFQVKMSSMGNKNLVYTNFIERSLENGINQIFYTLDSIDVAVGDYMITFSLLNENLSPLTSVTKIVRSRLTGLTFVIKDLEKAIDQMVYIAGASELDDMKKAENYNDKLKLFLDFWKKRDPSTATEENEIFNEYFRRVEFANKNFSNYMEGWRSDMGMVYIILGAPDNIDRHPFDYNSKPYEIWEYFELNRRFVFIDNTGFGDYRLITPLYGDSYRYRP
ncbi:MAG: GWxTD domain-containing protein [Ignavibacteriaceae bacterium]|nr:GWxTD domain-containing protein [Ignavibacteriaceae bacterium]